MVGAWRKEDGVVNTRDHSDYARCYERWSAPLRRHPRWVRALQRLSTVLTAVFYGAYGVLIVEVALSQPVRLLPLIGVLGGAFAVLSWYRRRHDAPRPYERYAIEPLIPRDGAGCSFPSRHTFSAFAIATAWWAACVPVAAVLEVCACLVGVVRVGGGVHFPCDVVVGALAGIAAGAGAAFVAALL